MFVAGRVIAIDNVPERLALAASKGRAEIVNFDDGPVYDRLMETTAGRGPDRCIEAVGAEAHGSGSFDAIVDKIKAATYLATNRPHALREAMMCCRKGGTISMPGVYFGYLDKIPMGAFMNKGLTLKTGQTHTHRYLAPLLEKITSGEIDPSFVITHRAGLEDGPGLYQTFRDKEDGCIKVVLTPWTKGRQLESSRWLPARGQGPARPRHRGPQGVGLAALFQAVRPVPDDRAGPLG